MGSAWKAAKEAVHVSDHVTTHQKFSPILQFVYLGVDVRVMPQVLNCLIADAQKG